MFKDYVVVYMKKNLVPTILIHEIKKKENKLISMDAVGEIIPRVNKVKKI